MMEAVSSSETLINIYQTTRCNIPEGSHLHTRRREKLKCHHDIYILCIFNFKLPWYINNTNIVFWDSFRNNFCEKIQRLAELTAFHGFEIAIKYFHIMIHPQKWGQNYYKLYAWEGCEVLILAFMSSVLVLGTVKHLLIIWIKSYLDLRGMKWQEVGENSAMRSCMVCTLHPVLLGWSEQGGWDGRGMWRAWGWWGVHKTFWLGGLKEGDH
jgi:hypothetical protein